MKMFFDSDENDESMWQSEWGGGGGGLRFFFLMGHIKARVFASY